MRNQEASTVAKLLMDRVICVHGCPIQILTDQGPNFERQLFSELCRRMSIDKIRTSPYKPSTNGNIEPFHVMMHSMLAKWVSENQRDWDDKLPAVAFAYRTTPQEATGYTPFFLQFGRESPIPADIVYGTLVFEDLNTDEFVTTQQQRLHTAFEHTREHLGAAAKRRKHQYDLRTRPRTFAPGSWVWCYNPRRRQGRYQKWRSLFTGPFQVVRQMGPVNYEIRRSPRARPWVVHVDKLKPCEDDPSESADPALPATAPDEPEQSPTADAPQARPMREIRRPARYQ